ncbi:MAG: hypothetical protein IJN54_08525 [Lachnospiraceae bacterium]|nr:hypothetical protein [Lachnospiraceae bacterium]
MKTLNYWQQFCKTGDPKDYLFYKEKEQNEQERAVGKAGNYAGDDHLNRNHIEDSAYRGLR